jgi:uncharacterized Zn finger protein
MAISACPKCGNHTFEMKLAEPHNSNYKINLVQCMSCGTVVGVTDYYNLGAELKSIKKHLGII